MLYAILCYNDEKVVTSWTQAEDDAVMARLAVVHDRLTAEGKRQLDAQRKSWLEFARAIGHVAGVEYA